LENSAFVKVDACAAEDNAATTTTVMICRRLPADDDLDEFAILLRAAFKPVVMFKGILQDECECVTCELNHIRSSNIAQWCGQNKLSLARIASPHTACIRCAVVAGGELLMLECQLGDESGVVHGHGATKVLVTNDAVGVPDKIAPTTQPTNSFPTTFPRPSEYTHVRSLRAACSSLSRQCSPLPPATHAELETP
jgi:hypothetical protein